MRILVINGSHKGTNSITLHTGLFLEKKFPGHRFIYIDADQGIKDHSMGGKMSEGMIAPYKIILDQ